MNGKDNIINKILADADAKCTEIIAQARAQAQQISDVAKALADAELQTVERRLAAISEEREHNLQATAVLEARKYRLLKKQQLISSCYDKARQRLLELPDSEKKKFLGKLIEKYAENGETVRISRADKDVVTQKFLDGFHKNLSLGKTYAECGGGIILEGDGYDKDLSLDKILSFVREETEADVAKALFGE